jgi:hypothetical protein
MKQGRASVSGPGSRKVEPHGPNYTPGVVSQIGENLGNHATDSGKILHGSSAPMYAGRDDNLAPKAGMTVHHGGSQRRHD